jgi:hypothetical protein
MRAEVVVKVSSDDQGIRSKQQEAGLQYGHPGGTILTICVQNESFQFVVKNLISMRPV